MSEACCDNGLGEFKDFSVSDRDIKGYNGEIIVKNELDRLNIDYISNPLENIKTWKLVSKVWSRFQD